MRGIAILTIALLLAGCEHMYGAMDAGRLAPLGAPASAH